MTTPVAMYLVKSMQNYQVHRTILSLSCFFFLIAIRFVKYVAKHNKRNRQNNEPIQ